MALYWMHRILRNTSFLLFVLLLDLHFLPDNADFRRLLLIIFFLLGSRLLIDNQIALLQLAFRNQFRDQVLKLMLLLLFLHVRHQLKCTFARLSQMTMDCLNILLKHMFASLQRARRDVIEFFLRFLE